MLAEMIKSEHPQIVAMIFAYMEPEQADALIQHLPPELVEQVIPRLATLDSIPPAAIRELNESIEDLLAGEAQQARVSRRRRRHGGQDSQPHRSPSASKASWSRSVRVDAELAQRIENSMFVFEDLMRLDDRNFQMLLRSVDQKLLASALKGADPKLLDKVMRNLSQRSAEMLREEISARGPMRVTEIDAAKREIVAIAQRLEREGTIILPTDAGDMVTLTAEHVLAPHQPPEPRDRRGELRRRNRPDGGAGRARQLRGCARRGGVCPERAAGILTGDQSGDAPGGAPAPRKRDDGHGKADTAAAALAAEGKLAVSAGRFAGCGGRSGFRRRRDNSRARGDGRSRYRRRRDRVARGGLGRNPGSGHAQAVGNHVKRGGAGRSSGRRAGRFDRHGAHRSVGRTGRATNASAAPAARQTAAVDDPTGERANPVRA